jgi:hypothetical protein
VRKSTRARLAVPALIALLAPALLVTGCGNGNTDPPDTPAGDVLSIDVSPGSATLIIEGDSPATAAFTATALRADGSMIDVTDQVQWSLEDTRLGSFEGATLTTGTRMGGKTHVRAQLGNQVGTADVTLLIRQRYSDPAASDLPDDVDTVFDGPVATEPARSPTLVYPNDGVLVPPNLRRLEIHFRAGERNTLFELAFSSETTDVKVYTRCTPLGQGCVYTPDQAVWPWIAESNRGMVAGLAITVRGTDDQGTAVAMSEPLRMAFSQDDIEGAVYYWTTSDTADSSTAIMRFDFGQTENDQAERFVGTEMTGGYCVGCHALSRSGESLITSSNSSYNAYVLLVDVATREPLVPFDSTPRSAFSAWNPDGSRYVGAFANEQAQGFISYDLNVFDGATGEHLETIAVNGSEDHPTTHPDWSPDGESIVFSRIGYVSEPRRSSGTNAFAEQSSVRIVRNQSGAWQEPQDLTESIPGQATFYPAFSPGGDLIVLNRSVCDDGVNGASCDAYDDPGAALLVMKPEPGAPLIELAAANAPGVTDTAAVVQSSYPKWAPFTFRRSGEFGTRLHWVTFSSERNYGLRSPQPGHTLIWMAAVNPDAASPGQDPSYPAFALPFQDLTTDNHTAQWAERAVVIE